MSSSCLVPRGEQAGPAWNCVSPSSGNVLRLSNVSPGQPPRGCLAWDFRQLPSRWMGLGRTVRSGLKGEITQAHFFPSRFKPSTVDSTASKLSLPRMVCCSHRSPERSAKREELRPHWGMEVLGASTSSWGWSWEGRFQPGGLGQG